MITIFSNSVSPNMIIIRGIKANFRMGYKAATIGSKSALPCLSITITPDLLFCFHSFAALRKAKAYKIKGYYNIFPMLFAGA
jgi:hypothetical protein